MKKLFVLLLLFVYGAASSAAQERVSIRADIGMSLGVDQSKGTVGGLGGVMASYQLTTDDTEYRYCYEVSIYGRMSSMSLYIGSQWAIGIPSKDGRSRFNGFGFGAGYKLSSTDNKKDNYWTPSISYHGWISKRHSVDFMIIDHKNIQLQMTFGWYLDIVSKKATNKSSLKCP